MAGTAENPFAIGAPSSTGGAVGRGAGLAQLSPCAARLGSVQVPGPAEEASSVQARGQTPSNPSQSDL